MTDGTCDPVIAMLGGGGPDEEFMADVRRMVAKAEQSPEADIEIIGKRIVLQQFAAFGQQMDAWVVRSSSTGSRYLAVVGTSSLLDIEDIDEYCLDEELAGALLLRIEALQAEIDRRLEAVEYLRGLLGNQGGEP
jgi:hypothetical protein